MANSTGTESSKLGKAKLGPAADYAFNELPGFSSPEQRDPTESDTKADFPFNPSPSSRGAARNPEPEEEISQQTKQGRNKLRRSHLLDLFYRKPKVRVNNIGRGREKLEKPVKWADLRGKIVKSVMHCARASLAGRKPTTGIFTHSDNMEEIWDLIALLIAENRLQFQELLEQIEKMLEQFSSSLNDHIFRTLYEQDIWKQLHELCMQLLLGDQEPISPEDITRLSTELNLYQREDSSAQCWVELRQFLRREMMGDGDFDPYDPIYSVLAK